ncbi:MAG: hypothetical protein MUC87_05150 [Bacteroidia bacterium]|jgi:hypothetical protein|nr:hypothetical protein [Bacteroidia bacterium]
MATNRNELKNYFLNGKKPNQDQFAAFIDEALIKTDDKLTITPVIQNGETVNTRVGINDNLPDSPLSVKAQSGGITLTLKSAVTDANHWRFIVNQSVASVNATGLTIARDETNGTTPRLHIDERGFVGIGTQTPQSVLHIFASQANGSIAIRFKNAACSNSWSLAHTQSTEDELNERFSINSVSDQGGVNEFFTISSSGNTGIGTSSPAVKLTVFANTGAPNSTLRLDTTSGLFMAGNNAQNVSLDGKGIQSRTEDRNTNTITAGELSLQPLGGKVIVHTSNDIKERVQIENNGRTLFGLNSTPNSRIELKGSIRLHPDEEENEQNVSAPGTIRYKDGSFEAHNESDWIELGVPGESKWQEYEENPDQIRFQGNAATGNVNVIVGNGPAAGQSLGTFSVFATGTDSSPSITGAVINLARTYRDSKLNTSRFGLAVNMALTVPNTSGNSRDVGLWIRTYEGTVARPENRMAAIFDGNVVVGTHLGSGSHIGSGGSNVLAISTEGTAPTDARSTSVQIYAKPVPAGGQVALHLMNPGNAATPVRLYRTPRITTPAAEPVDAGSAALNAYIANLVARVADLEARLVTLGLLTPQA